MNIIVNGGTGGIGKEIVLRLAQGDNKILVTGRNRKVLKSLSDRFSNIETVEIDLSVFNKYIESVRDYLSIHFRKVDILINMAGLLVNKEFMEISESEARLMMETNFFGPASLIRVVKPFMRKGSHIVNISSMGGYQGSSKYKGLSYYSASKAALACLSECLSVEFADSDTSVNCLALGAVQTEMFSKAFPGLMAPINARNMAEYISEFALNGHKYFNGKIIPVAVNNP